MVVNKRKKVTKYRGNTSHGCGHHKKRRGAGSRGGRGRAGTGKRAGHKKAGLPPQLGKVGFTSKRTTPKVKAINIVFFTKERLEALVRKGKAIKEKEFYSLDLAPLGYGKLLGTGDVKLKLKIKVRHYSAQAEEKVKSAGGELISPLLSKNTKEKEDEEQKEIEEA